MKKILPTKPTYQSINTISDSIILILSLLTLFLGGSLPALYILTLTKTFETNAPKVAKFVAHPISETKKLAEETIKNSTSNTTTKLALNLAISALYAAYDPKTAVLSAALKLIVSGIGQLHQKAGYIAERTTSVALAAYITHQSLPTQSSTSSKTQFKPSHPRKMILDRNSTCEELAAVAEPYSKGMPAIFTNRGACTSTLVGSLEDIIKYGKAQGFLERNETIELGQLNGTTTYLGVSAGHCVEGIESGELVVSIKEGPNITNAYQGAEVIHSNYTLNAAGSDIAFYVVKDLDEQQSRIQLPNLTDIKMIKEEATNYSLALTLFGDSKHSRISDPENYGNKCIPDISLETVCQLRAAPAQNISLGKHWWWPNYLIGENSGINGTIIENPKTSYGDSGGGGIALINGKEVLAGVNSFIFSYGDGSSGFGVYPIRKEDIQNAFFGIQTLCETTPGFCNSQISFKISYQNNCNLDPSTTPTTTPTPTPSPTATQTTVITFQNANTPNHTLIIAVSIPLGVFGILCLGGLITAYVIHRNKTIETKRIERARAATAVTAPLQHINIDGTEEKRSEERVTYFLGTRISGRTPIPEKTSATAQPTPPYIV